MRRLASASSTASEDVTRFTAALSGGAGGSAAPKRVAIKNRMHAAVGVFMRFYICVEVPTDVSCLLQTVPSEKRHIL